MWFRSSFRPGRKWNLVSACCRRSTALSGPALKQIRLCNMTGSHRPSASGHTLNILQLISLSCLNRPRRSCTVVVYLLQFVGIGYLDRLITSSQIQFRLLPKYAIKFRRQVQLWPYSHFSVMAWGPILKSS